MVSGEGSLSGWGTTGRGTDVTPSGRDPGSRRRRRQAWTFSALVSIVMLAGVLAAGQWMRWWTFGEEYRPAAAVPCPEQQFINPKRVSVNVYNATDKFGLARSVAVELQGRGFRVATIATDPNRTPVKGAVIVRYGPGGAREARTLAAQVAGPVTMQGDQRPDRSVDLVVGPAYRAMKPRPEASKAIQQVPRPEGCVVVTATPSVPA